MNERKNFMAIDCPEKPLTIKLKGPKPSKKLIKQIVHNIELNKRLNKMIDFKNSYKNCLPLTEEITKENQLVVYTLVRKSLGMSVGKIAGQCQHAMQYFMLKWNLINNGSVIDGNLWTDHELFKRMLNWLNSETHTKVVLTVSDIEWDKLKEEYDFIYVIDAGKTEIAAGSETVAILYPMLRSERSKVLKRCQVLKDG